MMVDPGPWALARPASEEKPDLLVDFSTLTATGLGPALAGFFTEDDNVAQTLSRAAAEIRDPVWRHREPLRA